MTEAILITGGCGFIGTNLTYMLLAKGYRIRILDNMSRASGIDLSSAGAEVVDGDVRDQECVEHALRGIDTVVHLAAYGSVIESVSDPLANFNINALGTLIMLRAAAAAGIRKFIFASTSGGVIGEAKPPLNEEANPKPLSPYGASKLCGEAYCHAFARSYGLNALCLRFTNVYGPYSAHKRGAVTNFIKSILIDVPLVIHGDGSASRDFLYVDDLCQGIALALQSDIGNGTVLHLASGIETTIRHLATTIMGVTGYPNHTITYARARQGEVGRNFSSYERAHKMLGFSPSVLLREGLERTWLWFKDQDLPALSMDETDA